MSESTNVKNESSVTFPDTSDVVDVNGIKISTIPQLGNETDCANIMMNTTEYSNDLKSKIMDNMKMMDDIKTKVQLEWFHKFLPVQQNRLIIW